MIGAMAAPASDRFTPLSLAGACNAERGALPEALAPPPDLAGRYGRQAFRGVPFDLGAGGGPDVVLVAAAAGAGAETTVTVPAGGLQATYLVFLHHLEDRGLQLSDRFRG